MNGASSRNEAIGAVAAAVAERRGPAEDGVRPDSPPDGGGGRRKVRAAYDAQVADLSAAIVRAQRPIRILDAVKWRRDVARSLLKHRFEKMPAVGRAYYEKIPLRFDPAEKIAEFEHIRRRILKRVGSEDALGKILLRTVAQYQQVVRMLEVRGTREFYRRSRELYGSPKDRFGDGRTTIRDLGRSLSRTLGGLEARDLGPPCERTLTAGQVVEMLNRRLEGYFQDHRVHARLSNGIVSDAAAGADYVKIKKDVLFSPRDVDVIEVHEGWAHVGTTLNGRSQRVASWLAKGPPCTCAVQEGLGVLLEILTFNSQPVRAKKLNNRILAIDRAEEGADLLDVIEFYRTEGYGEVESIANAQRVFRGGVVRGGAPFTKDISYCKGVVANYHFLRTCIRFGRPELIPFLFAGKLTLEDVPVLYEKWREGLIDRPRHVPRPFRDLNGLAMWLAYSNFLDRMDGARIQENLRPAILGA